MTRHRLESKSAREGAGMVIGGHRWQLVLFLAAVFVPCAALIAVGVRMVAQDRELQAKWQADERLRIVDRARRELTAALDQIRSGELRRELQAGQRYRASETVFVGWTEEGRLALPWDPDRDSSARACRELVARAGFGQAIASCEQPRSRPAGTAAVDRCYLGAIAAATEPEQTTYAEWLWARALVGAGATGRAAALYRRLLQTRPEITDEDGTPLALHAAQALLGLGGERGGIVAAAESALSARPWMPPTALFVLTNIAERLGRSARGEAETREAAALRAKADAQVRLLEQAAALQRDFDSVRERLKSRPPGSWAAFGDEIWLIGAEGDLDGSATVFAVRGSGVFRRISVAEALRLTDSREPGGESLGDAFPGLKLALAPGAGVVPGQAGNLQRGVLYLALLVVVAATVFAAYLLWRDLKREVTLAELRAGFVSSVSHELKTPLTAIRMYAETLQMGRCADADTQAEYLGTIVNECERLSRLVDGVLQFSRAEQGKRTWRFRPVRPAEVVHGAARSMEYPLAQRGFQLRIHAQEGIPAISADRDALEQAILNLLSNAMKFSGDAREIELGLYRENGEVVVRVVDHGIGIAPEEQARIFEKFYRAQTRENQLIPGTGLGLALVEQTAKAHGGSVSVESAPGKGSVFCLRLPLRDADREGLK